MLDRLHAGRVGEFRRVLRACAIAASRGRHAVVLKVPSEQDPRSFVRALHRYAREKSGRPVRLLSLARGGAPWTVECAAALGLQRAPAATRDTRLADLLGAADRGFERLRAALAADLATDDAASGPGLLIVEGDVEREATFLAFLAHLSPADALWGALPGHRGRNEQFVVVAALAAGAEGATAVELPAGVETVAIRPFHPDDVRAAPDAAAELLLATLAGRSAPVPTAGTPTATARGRAPAKREGRDAIEAAIEAGLFHDLPPMLEAMNGVADLALRCRVMTACGRPAEAIAAALAGGSRKDDASFLLDVSGLALATGDAKAATTLADRAARSAGRDARFSPRVDALRAEIAFAAADIGAATRLAKAALDKARDKARDRAVRASAANTLGKAAFKAGRHDDAESWYRKAMEACGGSGIEAARTTHNLGLVALRRGQHARAAALLQEAVVAADQAGETFGAALARRNLAVALEFRGRYQAAMEYAVEAVERLSRLGRASSLVNAAVTVADLLVTFGDADRALALVRFAEGLATRSDLPHGLAWCALKRGECLLLQGRPAEAAVALAEAHAAFAGWGYREDAAFTAARLAEAESDAGRPGAARTWIDAAGDSGEPAGRAATVTGRLALGEGSPAAAMASLSRGRDLLAASGPRESQALASWLLADASEALGDAAAATALREEARSLVEDAAGNVPPEHRKTFLGRPDLAPIVSAAAPAHVPAVLPPAGDDGKVTSLGPRPRLRHLVPAIVGNSEALRRVLVTVERVRDVPVPVLLLGESGTGKELFAEALHRMSPRASGPFVRVNAAAFTDTLLLSELFGHERGAFTGAHARKVGRFEAAHGGTLFLDEIGDVSERLQTALLRVIEEQRFQRVGGTDTVHVDVRLVFATNRDLRDAMKAGRFREDLYHRIGGVVIPVPPLRERADDIPALAELFLADANRETGRNATLAPDAMELLVAWRWPGNVRELKNVVRKACLMTEDGIVTRQTLLREAPDLRAACTRKTSGGGLDVHEMVFGRGMSLFDARAEVEVALIKSALAQTGGNISSAAQLLGMKRPRLSQMVKEYGLKVLPDRAAKEGS